MPVVLVVSVTQSAMTRRDQEILETLTHRVRVLSHEQVARYRWGQNLAAAKLGLLSLEQQGLILLTPALARPFPTMQSPMVTWKPGQELPDFGAVAYKLRGRWMQPLRKCLAITATAAAAGRMAGFGNRLPRPSELSHDLALAELYLRLKESKSSRAKGWRFEAILRRDGFGREEFLPDAMIVSRQERTVIELGGSYSKAKLQSFHEECAVRELPYEIW